MSNIVLTCVFPYKLNECLNDKEQSRSCETKPELTAHGPMSGD